MSGGIPSIRKDAIKRAARQSRIFKKNNAGRTSSKFALAGFAYAKVSDIRSWNLFDADVLYSPTCGDGAHSDLIARDEQPAQVLKMKAKLADLFACLPPEDLHSLPDASSITNVADHIS